jgi:hypothetical protein
MLNKFVESFRFNQPGPGLQSYLRHLQHGSFTGIPRMEEARRDYVEASRIQRLTFPI